MLDLLLAVVKQKQLEPILIVMVSLVRHVAVVLGVVAQATVGVVFHEGPDFGVPGGCEGAVRVRHLGVV